jgi:hypothetical protein
MKLQILSLFNVRAKAAAGMTVEEESSLQSTCESAGLVNMFAVLSLPADPGVYKAQT